MPLSDDQVLRYSRQILLPDVGGQGQERLLASGVALTGTGPAQAVAAAYLAAAGCSVRGANRAVMAGEQGFLFTCDDLGRSSIDALRAAFADMNPDALAGLGESCLGEVPAAFSGPGAWIALGRCAGRGEVLYRARSGCADCFSQNLSALSSPPASASALLGALGALVFQRLCLGLSDPIGRLGIEDSGAVIQLTPGRCSRCASAQ